jgi:hypothetical protein
MIVTDKMRKLIYPRIFEGYRTNNCTNISRSVGTTHKVASQGCGSTGLSTLT